MANSIKQDYLDSAVDLLTSAGKNLTDMARKFDRLTTSQQIELVDSTINLANAFINLSREL